MPRNLALAPSTRPSTTGAATVPAATLSARDRRVLQLAIAETRRDAAAAVRNSNQYATSPERGSDGIYRYEGDPVVMLPLSQSRNGIEAPGMRAYILPNTSEVLISRTGGFAGETTFGPFKLESTEFARTDYGLADIAAMQGAIGSLPSVTAAPNRPRPETRPSRREDSDTYGGGYGGDYPGGIFAEINRRAGGNI